MKKKPQTPQQILIDSTDPVELPPSVSFTEDEWHQPAADNKGHSAKLVCRVPPQVYRLIESLIASQRFPYQTADDLIRHAIVRHLHALLSYDKTIPRTLYTTANAIIRLVQDHDSNIAVRESLIRAAGMLGELAKEEDWAEVARVIAFVDAAINQMPNTSPWKRKFSEQWRQKSSRYREHCQQEAEAGVCPSTLPSQIEI